MSLADIPEDALYIARCDCHEWVLVTFHGRPGRCGECGAQARHAGPFDGRSDWGRRV